jgi:casein kinase II subunit beta
VPYSLIGVVSLPGAFFGTTFAHLFFQTYRELMPAPFWKQPSSSGSMSPSRSPRSVTGSNSSQQAPFVNPNPHGGQKRAAGKVYVPRIYGFKVSERAKSGPRMQWMRLRPESFEELDEVDWRGRWIDDEEDQYDDGIDGEAEEDRRMEDFDPVRRFFFIGDVLSYRHLGQDHADDDDDDDDEEEEEEEDSKMGAPRGGRRHATGKSNDPVDQPLVWAMATGSAFDTRTLNSRGPAVGQLISV